MPTITTRFSFSTFAAVLLLLLLAVGGLNYAVDPLWYQHGNRLTGQNFVFNERIAKINQLHRLKLADYDCLILGSSRVVGLRSSAFAGQHCFNLALAGAEVPEMVAYGRYAQEQGLKPATVYFGVDDFNFLVKQETERRSNPVVAGTPNVWHAYLSVDVLLFSVMTLAGVSPDADKYYDRAFEMRSFGPRRFEPDLLRYREPAGCNLSKTGQYRELRETFPQARLVAFAPPMSPWHQLLEVYQRGVLDCELDAFYAVAAFVDAFHDFGVPTALTEDASHTTDGTHFIPETSAMVTSQLQGQRSDLALDVKSFSSAADYKTAVRERLRGFLARENALRYWHDGAAAH